MWATRNASAANETARCTAWATTRVAGTMTMRSVATMPTPTAAVSAISARTPE